MPIIRNKMDQRIILNLKSDKNIDLFAKGTAEISDDELSSSHLQNLIAKGKIIVSNESMAESSTVVKTSPSYASKRRK